jgi:uroporphyrinogen-III synthase
MSSPNFEGLRVLALESRHGKELGKLIASYGGRSTVAPALREVALDSSETQAFSAALIGGQFQMVVFLTGSGARALITIVENAYSRELLLAALQKVQVVARGPKPASVLNELGVNADLVAPEPHTWREVLQVLDSDANQQSVRGLRIAVQEYGTPCTELQEGLRARGAHVTAVSVYRWSLPEDATPLREAARSLANGDMDVVLFTSAVQVAHLFHVAAEMKIEEPLRNGMERAVIVSIGPTTSERLRAMGLHADLEASRAKMGFLVREAAERSAAILHDKHEHPPLDFLHEIGSRMATASPLRGVLRRVVDFASSVVNSDSCFVYVLEGEELVLKASQNPHPEEVNRLKLRLGEGITGWVAKHREPVAVARNAFHDPRFQFFNELPEDRYEALLSVPVLCRGRLVGVISLQHREPYSHSKKEIRLMSTIGFLVGAEIEVARLEEKSSQLSDELLSRKVVERAKGILQRASRLTEEEAYFSLRRQSRQQRKSMKEIAEVIVQQESERNRKGRRSAQAGATTRSRPRSIA